MYLFNINKKIEIIKYLSSPLILIFELGGPLGRAEIVVLDTFVMLRADVSMFLTASRVTNPDL